MKRPTKTGDYAERLTGLSREYDEAEDAGDYAARAAVYDELLRLGAWMGSDGQFRGEGGTSEPEHQGRIA